jgi:hypothetical protein
MGVMYDGTIGLGNLVKVLAELLEKDHLHLALQLFNYIIF